MTCVSASMTVMVYEPPRQFFFSRTSLLQLDLFQRRRPWIGIDQHERGLGHARADAARPDVLPDRSEPHAVVQDLLDLDQERFALLLVGFERLLLVEKVDVGESTVGVRRVARNDLRRARRGVAVGGVPS